MVDLIAKNRQSCEELGEDYGMVLRLAKELACIVPIDEREGCVGCFNDVFVCLKRIRSEGPFLELAHAIALVMSQLEGVIYDLAVSGEIDDVEKIPDLIADLVCGLAPKLSKAGFGHLLLHGLEDSTESKCSCTIHEKDPGALHLSCCGCYNQ